MNDLYLIVFFLLSVTAETTDDNWDVTQLKESDFDRLATYFVPDRPCPPAIENHAEASLPRNLELRPSHAISEVSRSENKIEQ